jgi:hypothetical protein
MGKQISKKIRSLPTERTVIYPEASPIKIGSPSGGQHPIGVKLNDFFQFPSLDGRG